MILSHLHSLMVTMSQKSSVSQATKSVSQVLMPDRSGQAPSLSRMRKVGTVSHGKASVIWQVNHSAVGLVVTPIHKRCLWLAPSTTNAKNL